MPKLPESARVCAKKILLVEDEPTARQALKLLLMIDRHHVTEAATGEEAMALFAGQRFDLAIVDYFMPKIRGSELAANFRQLAPRQPIVMVTAYAEKLVDEDLAVNAILPKPFGIEELRQTIARTVR